MSQPIASAPSAQRANSSRPPATGIVTALQIFALFAFSLACNAAADALHSWIPGGILGFVLLYALLVTKIVRPAWIESGASLLAKHLSLFIVPVTVGMMALGPLLERLGWMLFVALVVSAAVGIALSGALAQALAGPKRGRA